MKVAAGLASAAIIIAGLYYGRDILIPLAIAFLITFALNPPVTWLVRRGLPRLLATSLVMAIVVCTLAGLGIVLGAQVRSMAVELPAYQSTMLKKLEDLRHSLKAPGSFDGVLKTVERVQKEVESREKEPADGPPPQRVEVVPTQQTPFEQVMTWVLRSLEPLATAGIIFLFVLLALLDIGDLRDRLLRLLGGDFHRSTDAMEEASARISRYLLMQLLVNASYGVPLAIGLWIIGVPAALLLGAVAAVMRFLPYIGPLIAAVFPIALAFAVDSGWNMLLWTVALIVILEVASNNVVEPLLYGSSTGLSAISLIVAAIFWTALWGPLGLILSTPLTVCLLVLGRNLPQFQFLDTMLGSTPALDAPPASISASSQTMPTKLSRLQRLRSKSPPSYHSTTQPGLRSSGWPARSISGARAPSIACVWQPEWMHCLTISGINTRHPLARRQSRRSCASEVNGKSMLSPGRCWPMRSPWKGSPQTTNLLPRSMPTIWPSLT